MTETVLLELDNTPEIQLPPTQDELLSDDGIPMETARHKWQMELLVNPLTAWLANRNAYVGGNMFVYFSPNQVKNHDFRGPDVFVALDVPKGERKCWVVWEEGKGPDIVIELLSESTAISDKQQKKEIYQRRLRVPEYFWFDPFNPDDFAGFAIQDEIYQQIPPESQGRLISRQLGLALVRWSGQFADANTVWLRWATLEGDLLPTDREIVEQERQRAEQAESLLERERHRAERLAGQLRALGADLDIEQDEH
ncbi:Uma2 family endonuclease [Pseudanabaena sp. PCC 6802]|uniref:Uma2 family endonuclease n=1 Tax=Pseudanabaena sp. PCC 6802 TaxID=118173 RepID=UPI00034768DF|nr:Uma2 family endonuclease [Pseudanabaena sp. PCC 6802]